MAGIACNGFDPGDVRVGLVGLPSTKNKLTYIKNSSFEFWPETFTESLDELFRHI